MGQGVNVVIVVADEGIGRVFPFADRHQPQSFREFHGHVFHGVDGQVCAAVQHSFFQFLDEQALAADFGQRHVQDLVTLGLYLDQFHGDVVVQPFQLGLNEFRLPQRKGAAAGCNAKGTFGHDTHCRFGKMSAKVTL